MNDPLTKKLKEKGHSQPTVGAARLITHSREGLFGSDKGPSDEMRRKQRQKEYRHITNQRAHHYLSKISPKLFKGIGKIIEDILYTENKSYFEAIRHPNNQYGEDPIDDDEWRRLDEMFKMIKRAVGLIKTHQDTHDFMKQIEQAAFKTWYFAPGTHSYSWQKLWDDMDGEDAVEALARKLGEDPQDAVNASLWLLGWLP